MTKVLRYSAALLFVTALSLLVGGSAAAQSTNNPRYRQFRDTAAASISNPSSGNVRLFFDSTGFYWKNSSGTVTAVGGGGSGISGLTTGVIPVATDTDEIGNSKMVVTGGSGGIWTLYDSGGTGITGFNLRAGASQSTNALATFFANDGTTARFTFGSTGMLTATLDSSVNDFGLKVGRTGHTDAVRLGDVGYGAGGEVAIAASSGNVGINAAGGSGIYFGASHVLNWTSSAYIVGAANDIGITRADVGILKITNGTTGIGALAHARPVAAKTTTHTVLSTESGYVFTSSGAGAAFDFDLPAAAAGLTYTFYCHTSTYDITIDAQGDDTITGATTSAAGGTAMITDAGSFITVVAISSTEWVILASRGTIVIT